MRVGEIRELIAQCKQHEAETGHLKALLENHIAELHGTIQLPAGDETNSLLHLITEYIDHAPAFIEAAYEAAEQAGISEYLDPFLALAEDFFMTPHQLLDGHMGLDALLDEAYLVHRLMEEANDSFLARTGRTLIPMQTTAVNLIIHSIIGEPFANQLDEAVEQVLNQAQKQLSVFNSPTFIQYLEQQPQKQWESFWDNWPCFNRNLGINLDLMRSVA